MLIELSHTSCKSLFREGEVNVSNPESSKRSSNSVNLLIFRIDCEHNLATHLLSLAVVQV